MEANRAILNTLLYSNFFSFPLKKEEIWFYLVSKKKIAYSDFFQELKKRKGFSKREEYYFISGNKAIVEERIKRQSHSEQLIKQAKNLLAPIINFPTVKLIGISGSLALKAAKSKDDIDIFVISEKKTAWITRFLVVLFLILKRKYRWKKDKNTSGKICLNMVIDESFVFPPERRDLYTAHEIAQMLPLYYKNDSYSSFMKQNKWISGFMPNVSIRKKGKTRKEGLLQRALILAIRIFLLEQISRIVQKKYMGRVTKEKVEDDILAFHPIDYRKKVLEFYKKVQN